MKYFEIPGNFTINFSLSLKDGSVFLFQIKHDNYVILCKVEKGYMSLIYKENGLDDKIIPLGCYIQNYKKCIMNLSINNRLKIEIDDKFSYSIGSMNLLSNGSLIYKPINGSQNGLKIFKFEKK